MTFHARQAVLLTKDGANAADFTVTVNPAAPVLPGGNTTFTIASVEFFLTDDLRDD